MVIVAYSCGDERVVDEAGRPATFGDRCTLGGLDGCKDPFVCLELPDFSAQTEATQICTVACQSNEDCPSWQETKSGACDGEVQSQCVRQICRDTCR